MSDPAVEAARVAFLEQWPEQGDFEFGYSIEGRFGIAAAREALKQIRELHKPRELYLWATSGGPTNCWATHETTNDTETGDDICLTCTAKDGGPVKVCAECFDNDGSNIDWPCATARLVYAEEELS